MKYQTDDDALAHEAEPLDALLKELPVVKPSRDLVAAAIQEAAAGRGRRFSLILGLGLPAAAAAALIMMTYLPHPAVPEKESPVKERFPPAPTDAAISARLARTGKRFRKVRSRVHITTFEKEPLSLSDRIKRAKRRTKNWKKMNKEKGEGYV